MTKIYLLLQWRWLWWYMNRDVINAYHKKSDANAEKKMLEEMRDTAQISVRIVYKVESIILI